MKLSNRIPLPLKGFAAILAMLILMLAVPGRGFAAEQEPAASALQQGLHYYRIGEQDRAQAALLDYLAASADPAQEPEAALVLARIYHQRGRHDQTLYYLQRIPEELRGSETKLLEGLALIRLGRSDEGLALLSRMEDSYLSGNDRGRRLAALATAHLVQQQWLKALYYTHAYLPLAVDQTQSDELLRQTGEVVAEQLSAEQLSEAAFMFRDSAVGQAAGLQLALRSWRSGNELSARRQVEAVLSRPNAFPGRQEAVRLRDLLSGAPLKSRALGVILPLSGRYAAFGKAVRRGMELAVDQLGSVDYPVKLLFRDSAGDAQRGAQAVSELANKQQALAVLGPLTGSVAKAAAARAQLERLPLLTLSQRDSLAATGPYVFRSSLTSTLQARALARYAIEERGLRTFAMLAPDNRLGREMSSRFAVEIERRGGQVVAVQSYAAAATDFRRQILLLKGEDPDAPQEPEPAEEPAETAETGEVEEEVVELPFEALFIPDYAERVGLIAPQLAYYGVKDAALLGINGWNDPELLRLANGYVEGAVFTDGFFRYSPYPFVRNFVNSYFERYGEEPSILEAQGYDAAGILLAHLARGEELSREQLRQALSRLTNYPGVAGATSFDAQGDAQKVLFLLQVQNGNIVQIN